jgi:hypothetical protein
MKPKKFKREKKRKLIHTLDRARLFNQYSDGIFTNYMLKATRSSVELDSNYLVRN